MWGSCLGIWRGPRWSLARGRQGREGEAVGGGRGTGVGLGQPLSAGSPHGSRGEIWRAVMPGRDEAESLILAQNERWRRA